MRASRARLADPLDVASRFLQTAVARRDVDASWPLVAPELRAGFTRAEWATGDIPIVPYPVDGAKWKLDYSFRDELSFRVALFPRAGAKVRATIFTLDLRAVGEGDSRRWLVAAFTPGAVTAPASSAGSARVGLPNLGPAAGRAHLNAAWLLVPLGVLGLAILVPVSWGLLHWRRVRSAERTFAREA